MMAWWEAERDIGDDEVGDVGVLELGKRVVLGMEGC